MGRGRRLFIAILGFGLLFGVTVPAAAIDKREVVTQARAAYYNLKAQGLTDFHCNATPNWAKMLEAFREQDKDRYERTINTLNQLSFVVSVNANGRTEVTYNSPDPGDDKVKSRFQDI